MDSSTLILIVGQIIIVLIVGICGYYFINSLFPKSDKKQLSGSKIKKKNIAIEIRMLDEYIEAGRVNKEILRLISKARKNGEHYIYVSIEEFKSIIGDELE